MNRLTVIIPVYNQEVLVKRALESVPTSCDIIVVDDGSTDNTLKTLVEFADSHIGMDVDILLNDGNKGVSYTVNKGIDYAQTEYVVLLGSDDYFYTGALERVMEQMDGTDLIYFNLRTNSGQVLRLSPETREIFCGSVKLMRRNFIGDTRNPEELRAREDWVFFQELLAKTPTEKYTDITAKHYNWPRKGSLIDLANKQNI
jgi:glycosyltransferase involved in cell wall biosynthesis